MLKYPSGSGSDKRGGGGGGGGGGLNFMHDNQPPGYIMTTTNHNYVNTLKVRSTKPYPNPLLLFSFSFFLSPAGPSI